MAVNIEITDYDKYVSLVEKVEFLELKPIDSERFSGGICIHKKDKSTVPFYGLIFSNDFEHEYGFIIIKGELWD